MNFALLLKLLPVIIEAIGVAKEIGDKKITGASIIPLIQAKGPQVLELLTQAGRELFPTFPQEKQLSAAASRFNPELTERVQRQLNALGESLEVDGVYGFATKEAVARFQQKNEPLVVDGWAGPNTQAKLNALAGIR